MEDKNTERFNSLVKDFLKNDDKYRSQIENFQNYLRECKLEDRVFNLYETNVDEFFEHALKKSIGTQSQLVSHIAALKSLFGYLIDNNLKFSELNGYISNPAFKEKYLNRVDEIRNREILSMELINKVLKKMDSYILEKEDGKFKNKTEEAVYLHILIGRLFIKISLLLPLKATQILEIELGDVCREDWHNFCWNDVEIKIPNNMRKDILFTIQYIENKYGIIYKETDKIFALMYSCDEKKNTTDYINNTFARIYKRLKVDEMMERKLNGKKKMYRYSAESYKKTAIFNMLSNGVNIVYLTKLTGLDTQTLLVDFNYNNLNNWDVSRNINGSLVACGYYEYL